MKRLLCRLGYRNKDRDVNRFLAIKDIKNKDINNNRETYIFPRVPFSIISSLFLLENTIQHHLREYDSAIALKTKHDIYVDKLVLATDCEEYTIKLYAELKQIFKNTSMNLREWIWSSQKVNEILQSEDRLKDKGLKVLDIVWNTITDDRKHQMTLQMTDRHINSMQLL